MAGNGKDVGWLDEELSQSVSETVHVDLQRRDSGSTEAEVLETGSSRLSSATNERLSCRSMPAKSLLPHRHQKPRMLLIGLRWSLYSTRSSWNAAAVGLRA